MRRLSTVGLLLVVLGAAIGMLVPLTAASGATAAPSAAQLGASEHDEPEASTADGVLDVVKVDGLLDPIMVDFILRSIDAADAEADEVVGLVLQVDSPGAVVGDEALATLVERIRDAEVPVSVWVGPSGGEAVREAAVLGAHAEELGMAPGTAWGLAGSSVAPELLDDAVREVPSGRISAGEAGDENLTTADAPTIGDLIVDLPGVETRELTVDDEVRREPLTPVRFGQLPLLESMLHGVASPAVAYLLLVVGMALLIFELFTAGVGIAGGVGAGSFLLGTYGLAVLPLRWWAVALLVLAMLAFAVDVQTGVPRVWTGVGFVAFVGGSLMLYDGVSMSWITLTVAFVGVALTFLSGMPSMVRTRFATPTIGREWMIGELGRAASAVDPDGVVHVRGALWRATTNRATPLDELDRVRVVGIDGLVLEVEPEEGGARDYRERARGRHADE